MSLSNPKVLSRLGPRGTFGLALLDVAERDDRILAITADLAITAGLDRFRQTQPNRLINVGIAEQNLVGLAAGMADEGWIPFAVTFGNFATMRACEFVRHHLSYMQANVKLIGIGAGFAMGQFGTTHFSLEDVSVLRAMPGLTIVTPADCGELVTAVEAVGQHVGPVYLRITGAPSMPIVAQGDTPFSLGKGSMVHECVEASRILHSEGIDATVVNMHTIKPLDRTLLDELAKTCGLFVTAEEHSVLGGLGAAVAEYVSDAHPGTRVVRVGVEDSFPKVGSYRWVLGQCGLTAQGIAGRTLESLPRRQSA
jgi:transketolase